jgi:hypothetical protein
MVGGQIPTRKLIGGKGKRVGEHEEVEGNLLVCLVGIGVVRVGLLAVSRSSAEVWATGGGSPTREASWGSWEEPAGQGQPV